MSAEKRRASGFTLIAVLLLMVLMSALAMGLMYMVNTEARVGGSDLENNLAYHAAEGGMEKMTADLATLYASSQAPTVANIVALGGSPPSITGVNYVDYSITVPTNPDGGRRPAQGHDIGDGRRSEEHTSELQSRQYI